MPEKGYGKCYYEWLQDMKKNSYKSKLKNAIDSCVMTSENFDDFLNRMQNEMNYEYKIRGHSLSFRAEEQERFTRCSRKSLGWYYDPEQIKKRIDRQVKKRTATISKDTGFYKINDDKAVGLNRWAALKNMQEASRLLNFLSDYGVGSVEQLDEKISDMYDQRFDVVQKLNDYESSIIEQRELLKMLNTYWEMKAVHDEFLKSSSKEKFMREHSKDLSIFNSSKEWLREKYTGTTLPNRAVLEMKITEEETQREALLENYHDIKKSLNSLETAKEKIERYFELERDERKKSKGELE